MKNEILFNTEELEYINSLWADDKVKRFDDRLYMSCYMNEINVTTKLLKWFEEENLKQIMVDYNVTLIDKTIEINGENSIDSILETTNIKRDFDILSIDVDNIDYHIWYSLTNYTPKIVIIEINPFFKPGIEYINDGSQFSSSFTSTINLGILKGYTLVCMTGNLIFVRNDLITFEVPTPNELYIDDAYMIGTREIGYKRYIDRTSIL